MKNQEQLRSVWEKKFSISDGDILLSKEDQLKLLDCIYKEPEEEVDYSFQEFWDAYGNKVGKHAAESKFKRLKSRDLMMIKQTLGRYLDETVTSSESGKDFKPMRKNPATYLNQKVWMDYEDCEPNDLELAARVLSNDQFKESEIDKLLGGSEYSRKKEYVRETSDSLFVGYKDYVLQKVKQLNKKVKCQE